MKLIVGLGNPGEKYEKTRHNLGFMVLDALLQKLTPIEETIWKKNKKLDCLVAKLGDLVLAKPQTFMNVSGHAVRRLITHYSLLITNLWVIHDDVDLPLGKLKIVESKGSAGHRGVKSIIEQLGTVDFVRFRLGIGQKSAKCKVKSSKLTEKYVLSRFRSEEKSEAKKLIKKTIEAIEIALEEGIEKAMNRFN